MGIPEQNGGSTGFRTFNGKVNYIWWVFMDFPAISDYQRVNDPKSSFDANYQRPETLKIAEMGTPCFTIELEWIPGVYGCWWMLMEIHDLCLDLESLKKNDTCHVGPRCVDIPGVNAGVRGWCLRQHSSCAEQENNPSRWSREKRSMVTQLRHGIWSGFIASYPFISSYPNHILAPRIYISVTNPATHQKEKVERLKSAIDSVYECLAMQPQHIYNLGKLLWTCGRIL